VNAITVKLRPKVYTVKIRFPGPQGPSGVGGGGGGSQLGDKIYTHPTSRKLYLFDGSLYYEHGVQVLDGVPSLVWLGTSTATPT